MPHCDRTIETEVCMFPKFQQGTAVKFHYFTYSILYENTEPVSHIIAHSLCTVDSYKTH